jgi:ribosome-associated protein
MTKKPHSKRDAAVKGASSAGKGATQGRARSAVTEQAQATTQTSKEGLEGAMRALALALEKKALEPVLLDVGELCSFCNYQLVVSGRSDRQVDAIADGIALGLKLDGMRPLGAEGARTGQWSLLDYGDFVVHVFLHAAREHYDLEGLWNDAPRIPLDIPPDARLPSGETYDAAP